MFQESIDKDFIETEFPICLNYPNLKVIPSDLSDNNAFAVGGLISQLSQASQDQFEDMAKEVTNIKTHNNKKRKISPYTELITYFTEMTSIMNGYCDDNDLDKIKDFFQERVGEFKRKAMKENNLFLQKYKSESRIVSSGVPQSKRVKAHGTDHY